MTHFPAYIITWLNSISNALGRTLLAPIGILPGWLSNTIVSAAAGAVLLILFKYTSNQLAIGKVRDKIKADLLALKLFKNSMAVTMLTEGRIFKRAFVMLAFYIKPMLIMILPISLLLGQLGLWYQYRPLRPGEETLVTVTLAPDVDDIINSVNIESTSAAKITTGPVRAFSKHQVFWKIAAVENGCHNIVFSINGRQVEKELTVGDGFMRVSTKRPGCRLADVLLHPGEKPFGRDSPIQSIGISYPNRLSRTSGTDWWLVYFFAASLVSALIFKPFVKVRI